MKSIKILRSLLASNPNFIKAEIALFYSIWQFSICEYRRSHPLEAVRLADEAKKIVEKYVSAHKEDLQWQKQSNTFSEFYKQITQSKPKNLELNIKMRLK